MVESQVEFHALFFSPITSNSIEIFSNRLMKINYILREDMAKETKTLTPIGI